MPSSVQFHTVNSEEAGQRLDNFLLRVLKPAPKGLIYRIIRKGEVRINKGRVKPDRRLIAGDIIRIPPVKLDAPEQPPAVADDLRAHLEDTLIYEDGAVIVVDKPSGLAAHGGSGIHLGLVEALRQMRPKDTLELVHRLDRDTSGCMIVAKKRSALRHLHQQLREAKGVEKSYLALAKGRWPASRTEVDAPLKKNVLKSGERMVTVDPEGKTSLTRFRVVTRFSDATLIEAMPVTGRTHQIRVHALHASHPLAGDPKYGNPTFDKTMRERGLNRLFLHAAKLKFSLPSGDIVDVSAPLPATLQRVLDRSEVL